MTVDQEKACPRCGAQIMKTWAELDDEQKVLAARLPASAEYTSEERKKHRYCTRCWFEDLTDERTTFI